MSIKLKGSTDGSVTLQAPADTSPTGTDKTLILPTGVGSANQVLRNGSVAGTLEFAPHYQTQLSTSQATTSGSAFDFTIPSWAQRITVMTLGTSVASTAGQFVQLGSGGTPQTSGYTWHGAYTGAATAGFNATTSFRLGGTGAANLENSKLVIQKYSGNTWSAFVVGGIVATGNYYGVAAAGHVTLSGTLDIVRFGTATTFDAGSVNIFVEG